MVDNKSTPDLGSLATCLDKVKMKNVIVVGDIFLDEYVYGKVNTVSTGIKIPIIEKKRTVYRLGGAANVAANIAGLCNNVILIGRYGADDAGNMVHKICEDCGVNLIGCLTEKTTVKQRIYIDNQQVSRLDTNCYVESASCEIDDTLEKLDADMIVVADYLYGVVSQDTIDKLVSYSYKKSIPFFLASRDLNRYRLNKTPIIVVNQQEWTEWETPECNKEAFVTLGRNGIRYLIEGKNVLEKKAEEKYPINVSGAGDTVLAVISSLYGEDISAEILLHTANLAGGLAVTNELTFVLKQQDLIIALYEQLINEDCINKIVDIDLARNIVSAWKTKKNKIVFTNGCYDLLHLGHVKSFQYSKRFGNKLVVAVNSDESVKRLKGNERPINNMEDRVHILAYLGMIDMVIPFNEDTAISVLKSIEPDTYVKGSEYKQKELPEAEYAEQIEYIPMIEGTSTTQLIKKITKAVDIDE